MMRKHAGRKHSPQRKGAHARAKSRARRAVSPGAPAEMGAYDPNRGEATS